MFMISKKIEKNSFVRLLFIVGLSSSSYVWSMEFMNVDSESESCAHSASNQDNWDLVAPQPQRINCHAALMGSDFVRQSPMPDSIVVTPEFTAHDDKAPYIFKVLRAQDPTCSFEEFNRLVTQEEPGMLLSHNEGGLSPLHLFVYERNLYAIRKMIQVTFEFFKTSCKDYVEFIAEILNDRDATNGWTPLHLAVYLAGEKSDDSVACLIATELIKQPFVDVNLLSLDGETPLDILNDAIQKRAYEYDPALLIRYIREQLIVRGAKISSDI
jgi:hypothetical protein